MWMEIMLDNLNEHCLGVATGCAHGEHRTICYRRISSICKYSLVHIPPIMSAMGLTEKIVRIEEWCLDKAPLGSLTVFAKV